MVAPNRPSAPISRNIDGSVLLLPKRLHDARRQPSLRILARRIAHHFLLHRQLLFEQQRIVPVEIARAMFQPLIPDNRASIA